MNSDSTEEQLRHDIQTIIEKTAEKSGLGAAFYRREDGAFVPAEAERLPSGLSSAALDLLEGLSDDSPEDVLTAPADGSLLLSVIAARDEGGMLLGAAVLFDEMDHTGRAYPLDTDRQRLEDATDLSALILGKAEEYAAGAHEIRGTLSDARKENETAHDLLERNRVMTKILGLMESENEFASIVREIIDQVTAFLSIDRGGMLRLSEDGQTAETLSGDAEYRTEDLPFLSGRTYTISSGIPLPPAFEQCFRAHGISAGAFFPVLIREKPAMYLYFVSEKPRKWSPEDLSMLSDVKKIIQQVLDRRIARNSLTSSYVTLGAILENTGCGVHVADRATGRVLYMNRTYREALPEGTDREELTKLLAAEDAVTGEYHAKSADLWFEIKSTEISWVDGRKARLSTVYDITKQKEYQIRVEREANTDFLTGLPNRKRFSADLEKAIDGAGGTGNNGALLYIDLDDFKDINDTLGHHTGDDILNQAAAALVKAGGVMNNVYRIGGDEFAVIVPARGSRQLDTLIHRIRERFSEPWMANGQDYYCTMSMGAVFFPKDGEEIKEIMQRADIALRSAKRNGKNRVAFYEGSKEAPVKRLDMENAMRRAVSRGCKEFRVYYQPLVDVSKPGHPCCGAEALVRWDSPELGFVMPSDFIPLAEYLGLIVPIGRHVLFEACARCRYWNDFGHPEYTVNVNLSVVQLMQENIVDTVEEALETTGLRPENLTLEVTEGLAIHDLKSMAKLLTRLKDLGVHVALDDFGTGYSSLSYLRKLPLDVIKIDKTFVDDVGTDEFSDAFVKTVSKLADAIDAEVVVEGVEEEKQAKALSDMHIDMIQGYLYDMPLPREEFEKKYVGI